MKEIAYAINPRATLEQECLVINLLDVDREGYTLTLLPVSEKRSVSQWKSLAHSPLDKEAFAFLTQGRAALSTADYGQNTSC